MVNKHRYHGLTVQTGDLLCMTDGDHADIQGQFWRMLGTLLPGPIDHIVIYLGPGGRCIEAGPGGVTTFEVAGPLWDASAATKLRGRFRDRLHGVAYPLRDRGLDRTQEAAVRDRVASYCLAQVGKHYNLNFLDSGTEHAFYCSQLAYKAYLEVGVNLNTGMHLPGIAHTASIIFPREIWEGLPHERAAEIDSTSEIPK